MSGPLSLLGGMEHTPGCEPIDRRLLDAVEARTPVVTLVPAASSGRKRPNTIRLGRRYWTRLGAEVRIAVPSDDADHAADALASADVVVLPGGDPRRLDRTLRQTRLLDALLAVWRHGAALTGSSAGAIALAEWRPRLRPPAPLDLVHGFGVLRGCAVAPHYESRTIRRWARRVSRRRPDVTILGIGERSGIVGADGSFRATGPHPVALLRAGSEERFDDGDRLHLDAAGD